MKLEIVSKDHSLGIVDCFVIFVWRRHTTVASVTDGSRIVEALAPKHSKGLHLMQVVETTAVAPTAEARTALSDMLRAGAGKITFSSVIQEGGGFRASMVRSIVTGLALLSNPGFPHEVFPTVGRGLARHAALMGISPKEHLFLRVEDAVEELRQAIDMAQSA